MTRDAQKLGRRIGDIERRLGKLERGAGPVEAGSNFLLQNSDTLHLNEEINIYKFELCEDAFVLDHPTQGELDANDLKLDHGYCEVTEIQRETDYELLGA